MLYPLIPWVGVMAAGYALGPVLTLDPATRARVLLGLGGAITAGFVLLRLSNVYGDPAAWVAHESAFATFLSLLNCEKYPPSLLYLMMTLGPALILLAAFEHARGRLAAVITTIGRVPFLYYVAHIFLIHALAVGFAFATHREYRVAVRRPAGRQAGRLRPPPARRLRRLAHGRGDALSAVPLVRGPQAAPPRVVVELSLSPPRHEMTARRGARARVCRRAKQTRSHNP